MTSIDEIIENFALLDDWDDRYRYVIELGRTLAPLPEAQRTEANKVQGCASQVWLGTEVHPDGASGPTLRAHAGQFHIGGQDPVASLVTIGFVDHHALGEQAFEGLVHAQMTCLVHRPSEEAAVEQVQDSVFYTAYILIHRQPLVGHAGYRRGVRVRLREPGEVP